MCDYHLFTSSFLCCLCLFSQPPECFGPRASVTDTDGGDGDDDDAVASFGFAWDCYSLAIMINAMWERVLPWGKSSVSRIYRAVKRGKRPPFSKGIDGDNNNAKCQPPVAPPSELRALCLAMWTQEPLARPSVVQACKAFRHQVLPPLLSVHEWGSPQPPLVVVVDNNSNAAAAAPASAGPSSTTLPSCSEDKLTLPSLPPSETGHGGVMGGAWKRVSTRGVKFSSTPSSPTYAKSPAHVLLEPPLLPATLPDLA